MEINLFKRSLRSKLIPKKKHTNYPKEKDIMTRFEHLSRIKLFYEIRLFPSPHVIIKDTKRPKSTRKPGIKNIRILYNMNSLSSDNLSFFLCFSAYLFSIICIPNWDLMSPPKLTRYTPITEIIDPIFKGFIEPLWNDFKFIFFISSYDFISKWLNTYKPLF